MVRMVDNLDLSARAKDQQCTMRCHREFKFALGCSCTVFQEVHIAVEIHQLRRVLRQLAKKSLPRRVEVHDATKRLKEVYYTIARAQAIS
jgi:hypothetical protein